MKTYTWKFLQKNGRGVKMNHEGRTWLECHQLKWIYFLMKLFMYMCICVVFYYFISVNCVKYFCYKFSKNPFFFSLSSNFCLSTKDQKIILWLCFSNDRLCYFYSSFQLKQLWVKTITKTTFDQLNRDLYVIILLAITDDASYQDQRRYAFLTTSLRHLQIFDKLKNKY